MNEARIHVVPYDPSWIDKFESEKVFLEELLAPWRKGPVEHVGSTAVVGLCAKPVIDIMVGVTSLSESEPARDVLHNVGYQYAEYRTDVMHWFCKPSPAMRTHHLQLIPFGSSLWHERLKFRDLLRTDSRLAEEYSALKRSLAARFEFDREAYTDAKFPFIMRALGLDGGDGLDDFRIIPAQSEDIGRYIDFMESVAAWLESRGIQQWRSGDFRVSSDYYVDSIRLGQVHLAFRGDELAGTFRLQLRDPIVWPDIIEDDAVYVYSLAVARKWAGQQLGRRMLDWIERHAASLGKNCIRLDCFADNRRMRHYYEQAGFLERGEIDAQYPDPLGTLHLQRYEKQIPANEKAQ